MFGIPSWNTYLQSHKTKKMKNFLVFTLLMLACAYSSMAQKPRKPKTQHTAIATPYCEVQTTTSIPYHYAVDTATRYHNRWIKSWNGAKYTFTLEIYPYSTRNNELLVAIGKENTAGTANGILFAELSYQMRYNVAPGFRKPEIVVTDDGKRLAFTYVYQDELQVIEIE